MNEHIHINCQYCQYISKCYDNNGNTYFKPPTNECPIMLKIKEKKNV